LEALSATGLRSIRYAKEIPDVKTVLANDISASACEAMRMNVEYNDAGTPPKAATTAAGEELSPEEKEMNDQAVEGESKTEDEKDNTSRRRPGCDGYVTVNESDAWYVRR
jgi:tRNA (guanine26-N2/guanine27-N2)-dimethyltransferase